MIKDQVQTKHRARCHMNVLILWQALSKQAERVRYSNNRRV